MPSLSTQLTFPSEPKARTSLKWRTSSRRRGAPSPSMRRSRKRFYVSFCRPTVPSPALSCAARASFFRVCGLLFRAFARFGVEEAPCHRVARRADVALREHDLEEVRAARCAAEHLGAAVEV